MDTLFCLRGHQVGVTAVAQIRGAFLMTGGSEGSIIMWDLETLRKIEMIEKMVSSRVQTIRTLVFGEQHIAVIQSRDDGLILVDTKIERKVWKPTILDKIPTCPNLFSKGDAINHKLLGALLSYASEHSSQHVTIRTLCKALKTTTHKDLERPVGGGNVFDIRLQPVSSNDTDIKCLVGYEDGKIAIYTLEVDQISKQMNEKFFQLVNVHINDFVTAFDISTNEQLVIGSALKELIFLESSSNLDTRIKLDKRGISSIRCSEDGYSVAVARWSSLVEIYSMESKKLLSSITIHTKQIQDIVWLGDNHMFPEYGRVLCCASLDGKISINGINL